MKIAFRVDASQGTGSGHVMRCLCLANQLRLSGAETVFVSLDMPEHLENMLKVAGHQFTRLPESVRDCELEDSVATLAQVAEADRMVLDHYGLSHEWEREVEKHMPVLAIDDLGRAHVSSWVLDQNYYEEPTVRYEGRMRADSIALIGPQYALLRPEFVGARSHVRARAHGIHNILVFLGGMDADNVTAIVLRAIEMVQLSNVHVNVVVGASHPALADLAAWCESRPNVQLHIQVSDMPRFMLEADLAIGAGGSSTWERCALGLPTVTLCLAENQKEVIREGAQAGFLWGVDGKPVEEDIADILRALVKSPLILESMSRRALAVTDAKGVHRVASALLPREVKVRPATMQDARSIYLWRTAPAIQAVSRFADHFSFEAHCDWLERTLANPSRMLLVGMHENADVGVVRFDIHGERAEVSIFLAPDRLGSGLGGAILRAAETQLLSEHPLVKWVDAWVNEGNQASTHMFNRLGYQKKISRLEKEIA